MEKFPCCQSSGEILFRVYKRDTQNISNMIYTTYNSKEET